MAGGSPDYLYLVVPLMILASCLWLWPVFFGKHDRGEDAYTALLSPTVRRARNAFDRRVAIAVREAKLGFFVCVCCGFTNPTRAKSCVLCSAAVQAKKKGVKAFLRSRQQVPLKSAATEAPAPPPPPRLLPFSSLTSRQQRIRRRKQWIRRSVPDSSIIAWYHDEQWRDESLPAFPSYVLQMTRPRPIAKAPVADEHTQEPDAHCIEIDVAEQPTIPAVEILTIQQVASMLHEELRRTSVSTIEVVTGADASVRTAIVSETTKTIRSDSVAHTNLDFPSKLAQFITTMAELFHESADHDEEGDEVRNKSRFFIDRENLLADSIAAMATMTPTQARGAIRVEFTAEHGIDAGGVYREWFLLLNQSIITPAAGLFVCVDHDEQVFYLNPHSQHVLGETHLAHFLSAGRLLGRALLEGNVTGFHLAPPLLKIILGIPVSVSDLEYFDSEAYKHLTWLLQNDGVDALGLDFTVTEILPDGTTREVELVPGGNQLDVTDANKRQYIDRKLQYLLFESVSDQLLALLTGIYEVVPPDLLMLFDPEELDYMLSGSDEIDVDDWQAHTVASMDLIFHPAYELFWTIMRELSNDELRRLLQFATGSTRVPPGGFGALTSHDGRLCLFTLKGVAPETTYGYLHSHACFNTLEVPLHGFLGNMRTAVRASIMGARHGFTTA